MSSELNYFIVRWKSDQKLNILPKEWVRAKDNPEDKYRNAVWPECDDDTREVLIKRRAPLCEINVPVTFYQCIVVKRFLTYEKARTVGMIGLLKGKDPQECTTDDGKFDKTRNGTMKKMATIKKKKSHANYESSDGDITMSESDLEDSPSRLPVMSQKIMNRLKRSVDNAEDNDNETNDENCCKRARLDDSTENRINHPSTTENMGFTLHSAAKRSPNEALSLELLSDAEQSEASSSKKATTKMTPRKSLFGSAVTPSRRVLSKSAKTPRKRVLTPHKFQKSVCSTESSDNAKIYKKIKSMEVEMRKRFDNIEKLLCGHGVVDEDAEWDITFPLKDLNEYDKAQGLITSNEKYKNYAFGIFSQKIIPGDLGRSINIIMPSLMINDVCAYVGLTHQGQKERTFVGSNIYTLIIAALRKKLEVDERKVRAYIGKWLRGFSDRKKALEKKQ